MPRQRMVRQGGMQCGWVPSGEERLVWLEDVRSLSYVREPVVLAEDRQGPLRYDGGYGRMVGYAVLKAHAQPDAELTSSYPFWRRL